MSTAPASSIPPTFRIFFFKSVPSAESCLESRKGIESNSSFIYFQSIQFHENGKKHKENVAKKLAEMRKKATKEAKSQEKFNKDLKKMENVSLKFC